jgi:hypothetical protein
LALANLLVLKLNRLQRWEVMGYKCIQFPQEMPRRILEEAWCIRDLWWISSKVRSAEMCHEEPQSSHWMERRFKEEMECHK